MFNLIPNSIKVIILIADITIIINMVAYTHLTFRLFDVKLKTAITVALKIFT